jgi:hypothetical protein
MMTTLAAQLHVLFVIIADELFEELMDFLWVTGAEARA